MTLPEMLTELYQEVVDEAIYNDSCEHSDPSNAEPFCCVCFITNLYDNVSMDEDGFLEETTEAQQETVLSLWEEFCNQ